jgi:hypothetical protein
MSDGREPQKLRAIFRGKRAADLGLLLNKFVPEIVIIGDQLERRGQAEVVAIVVQQLETKGVNGSKPGAVECRQDFGLRFRKKNLGPRALLHFIGGAIGEGEDNETRQHLLGIAGLREPRYAIGHGTGFSGARRRDHGKIPVERLGKTITGRLV